MRQLSNITILLALLLAGCASSPAPGTSPETQIDLPDLHGLAASPDDADVLFAATHAGLARWERGVGWAFVGDARDDLMGFTAHPTEPGVFWASGHPRGGGNMGVRFSDDGGVSWTTRWAEPVDFHAMAVSPADPDVLWGHYRGQLHRSDDGGRTWRVLAETLPQARALAAHPTERETLYATTPAGIAVRAAEGWRPLAGIGAFGLALDPATPSTMYAGGPNALWKSVDAGATWTRLETPAEGAFAHLAVARSDARVVYAGTYETGIYRSDDAGATWSEVRAPTR